MRIPPEGTNHPMSIAAHSAAYVEQAEGWARTLEDREAQRSGVKLADAREAVARRVVVPSGTLENLRKGRLKAIGVHIYDRLRAGLIRELEAEVRHLEHELQILRTTGADPRDNEIAAVVASLAKAREALGIQ